MEARPGLTSGGAQAGPGDLPAPAKGCTGLYPLPPDGPCRPQVAAGSRWRTCTQHQEERASQVAVTATPAALLVVRDEDFSGGFLSFTFFCHNEVTNKRPRVPLRAGACPRC